MKRITALTIRGSRKRRCGSRLRVVRRSPSRELVVSAARLRRDELRGWRTGVDGTLELRREGLALVMW